MDWIWVLLIAVRGVSTAPDDEWATRLAVLDQARASAFAARDPGRLVDVYASASTGRRADATTIDAYASRGGRIVGAELMVLSCRIVRSSPSRVRLEVVDQLGRTRVEWDDGSSTELPRDRPSRRSITVVRTDDGWRIARARIVTLRQ